MAFGHDADHYMPFSKTSPTGPYHSVSDLGNEEGRTLFVRTGKVLYAPSYTKVCYKIILSNAG